MNFEKKNSKNVEIILILICCFVLELREFSKTQQQYTIVQEKPTTIYCTINSNNLLAPINLLAQYIGIYCTIGILYCLSLQLYFVLWTFESSLGPVFSRSSFFVIVPFRSVLKNRNDSNRSVPFRSFRSYHGTGRNGTERNDGTEKPAVPN